MPFEIVIWWSTGHQPGTWHGEVRERGRKPKVSEKSCLGFGQHLKETGKKGSGKVVCVTKN